MEIGTWQAFNVIRDNTINVLEHLSALVDIKDTDALEDIFVDNIEELIEKWLETRAN